MKYMASILGLLLWLVFTLIMTLTIFGLMMTIEEAYLEIPKILLEPFKNNNK